MLGPPRATPLATVAARLQLFDTWSVPIGPLTLAVRVDPARAQAMLAATLGGMSVLRRILTIGAPKLVLDVAAGGAAAKGTIALSIVPPPQFSALVADLQVSRANVPPDVFRGDLVTWLAAAEPVLSEFDFTIGPQMTGHTTVRGFAGASAEFAFVNGSVILESLAVTQFSPTAVFGQIVLGLTEIAAGATITLTIPSQGQPGMLVLQACFPRLAPGSRSFSGAVATWPMP